MVKPKNGKARESYSVRLSSEIISQVKHLAVDEKKTVSQVIEEALISHLKKKGKR